MLLDTQITMPNQDPMARHEFSLASRDVRKWIKALPYIDQNIAAQQFYDGLRRSNRQAHSTKQRLSAIEIMRPVAREFLKEQRKYLVAQPFPLSKKAAEIHKLQQNIISELAVSYKIVIQETVNRDVQLSPKKLIVCIHHAMRYMLEQYVTLAQVYSEPPKGYWQDYCQLYKMAQHINLSHLPIKNETHLECDKSSANCLFKQACLLSLANLHTFGHGEAEKIAAYLELTNELSTLSDKNQIQDGNNAYFVNLALNNPPRLVAVDDIPISSENNYLNPEKLLFELESISTNSTNNANEAITSSTTLSKSLAERLLNKLTHKPKRANKRAVSSKEKLSVVHGLREAINTLLHSEHDEIETTQNTTSIESNLNLLPIEQKQPSSLNIYDYTFDHDKKIDKTSEAWDMVGRGNVVTDPYIESSKDVIEKSEKKNVKIKPVIQSWEISNASNGGYCLNSEHTSDYQYQIGDIILLRREDHVNEQWRLGIVRWMQSLSERGVKIGIETLHGIVKPVQVLDAHYSLNKFKGLDHILQFTEDSSDRKNTTLIAPPNSINVNETLEIRVDGDNQTILFEQAIERTISFVRFTYLVKQS